MRALKLTVALMIIVLASCSPALARSPTAASQQYSEPSASAVEVGDAARDAADTAARVAGALNDALSEGKSSAAAAATPSSQPDSEGKVAQLTMLPATGGVSPLLPGVGVLLMIAGVASLVRRAAR